jgi:dipeptidyl aminopeptidase/acylaminoacyl peptidase
MYMHIWNIVSGETGNFRLALPLTPIKGKVMITTLKRQLPKWMCLLVTITVVLSFTSTVFSEGKEEAPSDKIQIEKWLILGPIPSPFPVFNDEGENKLNAKDLLSFDHISKANLIPILGSEVAVIGGGTVKWQDATSDTSGVRIPVDESTPSVAYLAAYIYVANWTKIGIEASSNGLFDLMVDGSSIVTQKKSGKTSKSADKKTGNAKLQKGKHILLIKAAHVPGDSLTDWLLDVTITAEKNSPVIPDVSLDPTHTLNIHDILDVPVFNRVDVAPDGRHVMLHMLKRTPPEGDADRWLEIRRYEDGGLIKTFRDLSGVSNWQWAPSGNRISYTVTKDKKGAIRVVNLADGEVKTIIEQITDLSGYQWSPDGTFIVYSITKKPKKDETGVNRLQGLYDKRRNARNKRFLYLASVPSGMTRQLTTGEYTTTLYDIHPDSKSLLIGRSHEDMSERPYSLTELILLNLADQSTETLWKGHWLYGAEWSPDGKKILVRGGPSTFGKIGKNVPDDVISNDYDTQAFIFDPATKDVEAITKDFAPTVTSVYWPRPGGDIYFVVEETEYLRLYKYNIKKKTFKNIDLEFDVMHRRDAARDKPVAVVVGSSADSPWALYAIDMNKGRIRTLLDPCAERFDNISLGNVETWNFNMDNGTEIVGRIHYPPDFDPSRKWPCIVYYYGGTSPVGRSFGGRYPKNLWAANGYVVYVLQPSGATGFGQEFSTRHVNDWGKTTADEIIEGTKKFLAAHDFVDPARVGCIGASFGGFMTQLVITKTDIFAGAVSHAGISSISSYWGEGYWGYGYNAVSAANSFPWNRPDIYIDQSPLFAADKIVTPLLLLHGAVDTNVPRGESDQMYVALKLLGKEVEYIRFAEQDHFILDYKKRIAWSDAIIAWFDKCLKDEPAWWNDSYPPLDKVDKKPGEIGLHRVELDKYGTVFLGEITRKNFEDNLSDWFGEYFDYTPDETTLDELITYIHDASITCVLGTWCSDSQEQVPRLWKILDELEYPESELSMLAVGSSRFKRDMPIAPDVFDWSVDAKAFYDVTRVATIIISRDGKELGRIIETPANTLEKDLLEILKK